MGASSWSLLMEPEVTPIGDTKPTFDPHYGFKNGRKPREMVLTEQEMIAAQIPPENRDYCAHLYLEIEKCRRENMPWMVKCGAQTHAWNVCYYEDYVLRMKEYERERRLLVRKRRKAQQQQKQEAVAA